MKIIYKILIHLLIVSLFGCNTQQHVVIPDGMVPKRQNLNKDVYGGYVRLTTFSNEEVFGEFIGMYQDSLVIRENKIKCIHSDQIKQAQIYVFDYNSYWGGFVLSIIPNIALLAHVPNYGFGPFFMSAGLSGLNLIGAGTADINEKKMINAFDWNVDRSDFLRYARFPQGIPPDLPLNSIEGKKIVKP